MRGLPALSRLAYLLKRWRALEPWERRLLARLFFLLPSGWIGLRVHGFNRARERAEFPLPEIPVASEQVAMDFAQRSAELTAIAARHGFYKANCLHQSLALCRLLRRRGLPARLRIGVLPNTKPFKAHAWVELFGVPLGSQSVAEYEAFERLSPNHETALFV